MTIKENVLSLKDINLAIDRIEELEKENAELQEQVEALEEELQAERYMLKCRDDELAEARAKLENLDKRLRQVTTERSLAAEDFKNTQPEKITDYYIKLSERAKEQIKLEDLCWEDEEAKIKLDVEENKNHAKE